MACLVSKTTAVESSAKTVAHVAAMKSTAKSVVHATAGNPCIAATVESNTKAVSRAAVWNIFKVTVVEPAVKSFVAHAVIGRMLPVTLAGSGGH